MSSYLDDDNPLVYSSTNKPKFDPGTILAPLPPVPKYSGITFSSITDPGPNQWFYKRTPTDSTVASNTVYSKVEFDKPLVNPSQANLEASSDNKNTYYIPRNDQISVRNLIYGLEFNKLPSSGNTELYNTKFDNISIPAGYCPKLNPCIYDWCKDCVNLAKSKGIITLPPKKTTTPFIIYVCMCILGFIVGLAFIF